MENRDLAIAIRLIKEGVVKIEEGLLQIIYAKAEHKKDMEEIKESQYLRKGEYRNGRKTRNSE